MKKFIKPTVALALGLFASQSATAAELAIEQGTMSLGGNAGLLLIAGEGGSDVSINVSPSIGYFLSDNMQLFGNVHFGYSGGVSYGVGVGANYVMDVSSMKLYTGIHADLLGAEGIDPFISVGAQVGLWIGLSESVALDVGIRPNYEISTGTFSMSAGYLGVNAFF